VYEIAEKGLGLIAKRSFPALSRIMVDGLRSPSHPGIQDLMPIGGTLTDKINLNSLSCSGNKNDHSQGSAICLRIARVNHACNANANHWYDPTFGVKILFAERDIEVGEEICINYMPFNDCSNEVLACEARFFLEMKWGIICKDYCSCRSAAVRDREALIEEARNTDKRINQLSSKGNDAMAIREVDRLLSLHDTIGSSYISRKRTYYDGFQVAVMKRRSLKRAKDFALKAYEIEAATTSPNSERSLELLKWSEDPRTHPNYLMFGLNK